MLIPAIYMLSDPLNEGLRHNEPGHMPTSMDFELRAMPESMDFELRAMPTSMDFELRAMPTSNGLRASSHADLNGLRASRTPASSYHHKGRSRRKMAKVVYSSLVSGIAGKVDDIVYYRSRNNTFGYIRGYIYPRITQHNAIFGKENAERRQAVEATASGFKSDLDKYMQHYKNLPPESEKL